MVRQGLEGAINKHPQPEAAHTHNYLPLDQGRPSKDVIHQLAQAFRLVVGIYSV